MKFVGSPYCVRIIRRRSPLISPTGFGAVVAGDGDAVTARVVRLRAGEVIALVDGEQEQRVRLVDPVGGEAIEELPEGHVVVVQLLDVARFARGVREVDVPRVAVPVVGVRDVGVRDRDPGLLHLRDPGERVRREHPVEAGEAEVAGGVLDRLPVEVRHRAARMDHRVDVLRPEEAAVAGVSARLVREQIGLRVRRGSADRRSLGAVDAEADEVRERLPGIRARPRSPRPSRGRRRSGCRSRCSRARCSPCRSRRRHSRRA